MDNMLHPESLRTVTLVNGSYYEGRLGKLAMENGDCSFRTGPPKYKRRTVSAVRDFPLGCGPFSPRIQSPEVLMVSQKMLERKNALTSEEEKVLASSDQANGLKSVNAEPVKIQSRASDALNDAALRESVKGLDDAALALSKDLHLVGAASSKEEMVSPSSFKSLSPSDGPSAVRNGNGSRTMDKKFPPRRKVSAIRDFPHFCGRNAPRLSKEESLKVFTSKNKSLGQEKSDMDDRPLEETKKTDLKPMGEDVQNEGVKESKLQGNVSMITGDKFRAESNGCMTKEIRKRDEFGRSSVMKVEQDATREMCPRTSCESAQYQFDHQSETVVIKESRHIGKLKEKMGKEIVVYREDKSIKRQLSRISGCQNQLQEEDKDIESLEPMLDRDVVQGLMAALNCPWKKGKGVYKPYPAGVTTESKGKKYSCLQLGKYKSAVRTKDEAKDTEVKSIKKNSSITGNTANQGSGPMFFGEKEDSPEDDDEPDVFHLAPKLPPLGWSVSSKGHNSNAVTRKKVRETLRLFQAVCRKLLQEQEAKSKERGNAHRRVDYKASRILKEKDKYVNTGKKILGSVPGVEVGDEFHYRIELNIIGLHHQNQGGIDYVKHGGKILATSIVSSGGYTDDLDNSDSLTYTGQGGNVMNADKEPEDQKLEWGNLALMNSMHEKNPVRVIRGSESSDGRTYVYDGLYLVEKCEQELGPHGKLVFNFQLDRIPGQPELAWKEVRKSKKFEIRERLYVDDVSEGKELMPISAVNTIDDEKPPPFKYITSMIYPNWCRPLCLKGCNCTHGCTDSEKCLCAVKNGGEIPFNYNGVIVEAKPLVYECGRSCMCPYSCHNRVSQHGIIFQLQIFKTKSRGWGVRSLNSIPSGSFICEYIGELLEEKEAEKRTGNDEYLFDIGNCYNDSSLWDGLSSLMPDVKASSCEVVEDGGFTIDAAQYGNVGRFINHSCSPNLYAQNVLYDHEDKRIPHIMLFSAENIPPLQELTYHYNYVIDQVRDSNGNIKKKSCYCGSIECTGRMY